MACPSKILLFNLYNVYWWYREMRKGGQKRKEKQKKNGEGYLCQLDLLFPRIKEVTALQVQH